MSRLLRNESGSTLIAAVLIVFGMLAFGLALVAQADTQSQTSARERTRESSFNLAEGAMNAQILQLTRSWASSASAPSYCDPSVVHSGCPDATALSGGYTAGDYGTPCATDGSIPAWRTQVRDSQGEQYWVASNINRPTYDANGDGAVWIRSEATTHCHTIAMVTQVSQSQVPIAFPSNVITANHFTTTNQGKKVIVNTLGSGGQAAPIVARCSGMTTAQCLNYPANKGQVQPPAVRADANASSTTLSDSQLASLQSQAAAAGSYYTCTSNAAQLTSPANGAPVYLKGPNCNVSVGGNSQINSATKPGALIIENGTITLGGTVNFYGLIYVVNKQNSNGYLVDIGGNAQIVGIVSVDGLGGIRAGSSKTNLVNDPRAANLLRGSSGARANKNTFRIIPTD